jgi:hypothetical protein
VPDPEGPGAEGPVGAPKHGVDGDQRREHEVTPAVNEPRSRLPWILLVVPGLVGFYAFLGLMWHPLLVGPDYDGRADSASGVCGYMPWDFVVLGSWLFGASLIVAGIFLAIMRRFALGVSVAVTGILLFAASLVVFAVVAAHDYHLCAG